MEYESFVKHQPDSNSGLFLQKIVPTLGFHASRAHGLPWQARAHGQAFRDLQAIIFQTFFQLPLSLSSSHLAELVTSSHLLPVRGAFLWSFLSPFVSRLSWLRISGRAAVPVILISARTLSLCLYPFSSSNLAPVSSFPILCSTSLSSAHRRSLFPFAERDTAAVVLPELVHRGKMLREGRSNRRTATLISLPAHIPDSDDSYSIDEVTISNVEW